MIVEEVERTVRAGQRRVFHVEEKHDALILIGDMEVDIVKVENAATVGGAAAAAPSFVPVFVHIPEPRVEVYECQVEKGGDFPVVVMDATVVEVLAAIEGRSVIDQDPVANELLGTFTFATPAAVAALGSRAVKGTLLKEPSCKVDAKGRGNH